MRWRAVTHLSAQATEVLDAYGGVGWALADLHLRPHKVQVLADGRVYFTNNGKQRPSAVFFFRHHTSRLSRVCCICRASIRASNAAGTTSHAGARSRTSRHRRPRSSTQMAALAGHSQRCCCGHARYRSSPMATSTSQTRASSGRARSRPSRRRLWPLRACRAGCQFPRHPRRTCSPSSSREAGFLAFFVAFRSGLLPLSRTS